MMSEPRCRRREHSELASNSEAAARFVNEARAASSLKHRNIVTVHDCGQRPGGQWFIALEFLDGSPLSRFLASIGGPLDLPTLVLIVGQVANGLHIAHDHGIVHRDVKPENVFLTKTATNPHHATVLDFGIAKIEEARGGVGTREGSAIGTPMYMAPEQLRGAPIDRRVDVFALGCLAWEMATGQRLWGEDDTTTAAIIEMQIKGTRPLNPCAVNERIPAAVGSVIARALAFNREDRWPTAQAFALALAYALPASDWSENGIEILRRFANELTIVEATTDTAGRPMPSSHGSAVPSAYDGAPTLRAIVEGAAPIPALHTPPPPLDGRAADRVTVAEPHARATTLSSAARSSRTPITVAEPIRAARQRGRVALIAAVGFVAVAAIVVSIVVVSGDDSKHAAPAGPSAPPASATSALAIVTEPAGASILVDGAARGVSPINLAAPVGVDLEIRAELPDHVAAAERVRVGAQPATVRLTLAPVVDAGALDAPPNVDAGAGPRRDRSHSPRRGSDFDPDGVVQP